MSESRLAGTDHATPQLDVETIEMLYRKYHADLIRVREAQRARYERMVDPWGLRPVFIRGLGPASRAVEAAILRLGLGRFRRPLMLPAIDDIEAEITYMLVRETRPSSVVEISSGSGWSTSWILEALESNGAGHLYSYDLVDDATHTLASAAARDRWTFVHGDVRRNLDRLPEAIDYLFLDSDHSAEFADWYLATLMPRLRPGTPVSVHDVFHADRPGTRFGGLPGRLTRRVNEGVVLLEWLERQDLAYFTASRAAAPAAHHRLACLRQMLGFDGPIHSGTRNPMVFFVSD